MIKESMILTFSKGIRGILMLIFNMIISRLLSQSLYGTYKHINLLVNLFTMICTLGIPTSISFYYPTYSEKNKNRLISNTILILTIFSVLSALGMTLFGEQISNLLNNPDILTYIGILSIYISIMIMSSFLENLYIVSGKAIIMGKVYIIYTFTNFLVMITSVILFKGLYILVLSMTLIEVLRAVIMYVIIRKSEKLEFNLDIKMMINQIKFAIPLGVVSIVQTMNTYIDNLFISKNYTPDKYAAYANAAMDIPFVGIITVSVAAIILPTMSKVYNDSGDFNKVLNIWKDSCKKTALVMFPIFWIAMLFSDGYIELIFSQKYVEESTSIFMIYLLKFPLYCTVFGNILIVLRRQRYVMYNSVVGIVLNIILNSIFLNTFGMKGPAVSTVIVQYIVVGLQLIQISRNSKTKFSKLMPFRDLIIIFILPAFIAVPLFILSLVINIPQWMALILFGGIIYLVSFGIYFKFNYIDNDTIKLIK